MNLSQDEKEGLAASKRKFIREANSLQATALLNRQSSVLLLLSRFLFVSVWIRLICPEQIPK